MIKRSRGKIYILEIYTGKMDHVGRPSRGRKDKDQRKKNWNPNIYGKNRKEQLIKEK